jgi:hypothetical protein
VTSATRPVTATDTGSSPCYFLMVNPASTGRVTPVT